MPEQDGREDKIPEPPLESVTKQRNLWELGKHRVLCGDSIKPEDVKKLMGEALADSLATDPPYGVDYASKNDFLNKYDKGNRIQTPIVADAISNYREFYGSFLKLVPERAPRSRRSN